MCLLLGNRKVNKSEKPKFQMFIDQKFFEFVVKLHCPLSVSVGRTETAISVHHYQKVKNLG